MMRSLFSGVSGLKNHQTRMDVIGNNIANVNTTGFKGSRVTFQDLVCQNLSGASSAQGNRGGTNPMQIGLGMGTASIDTSFTDGSLQSTGKNTDLAISGAGFFILGDGANKVYTRSGSFEFDTEGNYVVPGSGLHVQGWMADANGNINTTTEPTNIQVPKGQTMAAKTTTTVGFSKNLSAEGAQLGTRITVNSAGLGGLGFNNPPQVGDTVVKQTNGAAEMKNGAEVIYKLVAVDTTDPADPKYTYTESVALSVFDPTNTSGKTQTEMKALGFGDNALQVGDTVTKTIDGVKYVYTVTNVDPTGPKYDYSYQVSNKSTSVSTISAYDSQGVLHKITGTYTKTAENTWEFYPNETTNTGYNITGGPFTVMFDENGTCLSTIGTLSFQPTQADAMNVTIDFSQITQYSGGSTVTMTSRDGYGAGSLESVSLDSSGTVIGTFSNGQTKSLAQVAMAVFNNPAGLTKNGTNIYTESNNSGMAQVTTANNGGAGSLTPSNLEMSNVDLSEEFSNMIVTQRGFQANSKIITVSDEMLETLSNLKR